MTLPEALTVHVAAGRIRSAWLPGMLCRTRDGVFYRIYRGTGGILCAQGEPSGYVGGWESAAAFLGAGPADDPATNGCLLALLREALPLCGIEIRAPSSRGGGVWQVRIIPPHGDVRIYTGPTEHVALSDALIAFAESP